ncbi:MAG: right-handed parallel beta-helix repeat-containing protein [Myxococcota bacterium]
MSIRSTIQLPIGLALTLSVALIGCDVGSIDSGGGGGTPNDPGNIPSGESIDISGDIAESATWSGAVRLVGETVIQPGVQIEVAPGTSITAAEAIFLRVGGTLTINGTAESPVSILSAGTAAWGGISVQEGGTATINHAVGQGVSVLMDCKAGALGCNLNSVDFSFGGATIAMRTAGPSTIDRSILEDMGNGSVTINAGADLTITDSRIFHSTHDIVIMQGGSLTIDHSELGGTQADSYEHCDLHIGRADALTITNSNIVSSVVGMMIANADGAVINRNNFMENGAGADIDPIGPNSNVNLQNNYWDQGAPTYLDAAFDVSSPAATPFAEAGPRYFE